MVIFSLSRWSFLLCVLACPAVVGATDWSTFGHDLEHTSFNGVETTLTRDNIAQLAPAWKVDTGGQIAAAPTIVNGVMYIGGWNGYLYALDAAVGSVLWSTYLGKAPSPPDPGCFPGVGITAQPAVIDDTVYVGGGDSAIYAIDRDTGAIRWRKQIADPQSGAYIWSSMTRVGRALYFGVASLGDCPLVRGAIVRVLVDQPDRTITKYLTTSEDLGAGVWSTPAYDSSTATLYVTTGNGNQDAGRGLWGSSLLALDPDTLDVRAHYFLPTNSMENDIEWGSSPTVFTAASGSRMVVAGAKDGTIYALNATDLSVAWTVPVAADCPDPEIGCGVLSTPAFDWNRLYAGTGQAVGDGEHAGSVQALDPETGAIAWRTLTVGTVIAPVTVASGMVFASTMKGVTVLDSDTGAVLWKDDGGGTVFSQPVVLNGTLYITYLDGTITAFRVPAADPTSSSAIQKSNLQ